MSTAQPTSRPRVEFAHILRGIAAGSVLLSHLAYTFWHKPEIVGGLIAYPALRSSIKKLSPPAVTDFGLPDFWGHFGVALFFLISGFVIPFSTARLSGRGFAIARVFRIWPTYMAGLTVTLICLLINARLSSTAFRYSATEILTHYFIVPRWPTLTRPIDGIVWTLEIEVFFYTFCLLVIGRLKRFDHSIFLVALLSVPMAALAGATTDKLIAVAFPLFALVHWASSMVQFVTFILIGTAFHYHHCSRMDGLRLVGTHILLISAFAASWRLGVFADQGWNGPVSYLAAYIFFSLAYLNRNVIAVAPARLRQPFDRLADISYPVYAVHGLLGYSVLVHAIEAGASAVTAFALALIVVITFATLLHILVEVPCQTVGRSLAVRFG